MTTVRPAAPFSAWERTLAARYLRTKRKNGGVALISIISFAAITLAVAVLIIVMSVMNGFREQVLARTLGFNGHAYVLGDIAYNAPARAVTLQRLRQAPGVRQVFPFTESQTLYQGMTATGGAIVRGMSGADLRATPMIASNIKQGSLRDFGVGPDGGDLVVVGDRLAANAGVRVGDPLVIASFNGASTPMGAMPLRKTFTVGAIYSIGHALYDQNFILMPLEQSQLFFGMGTDLSGVMLMVDDPLQVDLTLPAIKARVGPADVVEDWTSRDQSYWSAIQIERNMMRIILMLIIGIAALNIVSGLVMLVKNKGRDIAILRTMGAGQGAVTRIFFMSGAAIGILATPAGVILGVLFCHYIDAIQGAVDTVFGTKVFNADVYFLTSLPAKIDWGEVVKVTVWTLFMSCITTIWPAWRGSKIDPVEALRYE